MTEQEHSELVSAVEEQVKLTEYIKWLLSQLDEINSNDIDKDTVKTMLLSIIGEMYSH